MTKQKTTIAQKVKRHTVTAASRERASIIRQAMKEGRNRMTQSVLEARRMDKSL